MLVTALLQILPDIRQGLQGVQQINWLAELVVCAGFFLGYILEKVLIIANEKESVHESAGDKQNQSDMEMREADCSNTKYNPKYEVRLSITTNEMFPTYHSPEDVENTEEEEKKNAPKNILSPATKRRTTCGLTAQVQIAITGLN